MQKYRLKNQTIKAVEYRRGPGCPFWPEPINEGDYIVDAGASFVLSASVFEALFEPANAPAKKKVTKKAAKKKATKK